MGRSSRIHLGIAATALLLSVGPAHGQTPEAEAERPQPTETRPQQPEQQERPSLRRRPQQPERQTPQQRPQPERTTQDPAARKALVPEAANRPTAG
jgi:hypothetical protein